MTYAEALERLKRGNAEFLSRQDGAVTAGTGAERRAELAENGQKPFAVVVSCSDSRVVPEYIFSAGLGNLFVVRTAGNAVGDFERGTVEYGVLHLGAKLVVVLGHTHCGAVAAALEPAHGHTPESLGLLVAEVASAVAGTDDPRDAERLNARRSAERLLESDALATLAASGEIAVVSAVYDIRSGAVNFA
ncbi:MAG: carbonic anhydrase [Oscillospiraceae bacterium]|jgi:carbonic anhydrase|nr:carbonic anhydrase [Oscillospiraceae bacterium]